MNQTVRGMIVTGIKLIPLTNIPLTKYWVQMLAKSIHAEINSTAFGENFSIRGKWFLAIYN